MLSIKEKIAKLTKELQNKKTTRANRARLAGKIITLLQLEAELEKVTEDNIQVVLTQEVPELKSGDAVFRYKGKERLTGILVILKNKLAVQLASGEIVPFYSAWQNEEKNVAILSAQKQDTFKPVQMSLNL